MGSFFVSEIAEPFIGCKRLNLDALFKRVRRLSADTAA